MRDFLDSVELPNLIKSVDTGRQTTVETEDLSLNDGSQRQVIKELCEVLPHIRIAIFPQTFIVESVPIQVLERVIYT